MNKIINKCNICGKILRNKASTMMSASSSGAMIVSYICKQCVKNKSKINDLQKSVDKQLDDCDKEIINKNIKGYE